MFSSQQYYLIDAKILSRTVKTDKNTFNAYIYQIANNKGIMQDDNYYLLRTASTLIPGQFPLFSISSCAVLI